MNRYPFLISIVLLLFAWSTRSALNMHAWPLGADLGFTVACAVVFCGLVLRGLSKVAPMMGASEARWVARQVSLWTVPTLVSSAAAFVMVLDMTVGVVRAPQVSPLVVERVLCTRTSSTKIRVMIESESDGGRQCFQAASDRASTGQLWRVHTGAVVPSREVGAQGVLKVAAFPSLIWGAQAYKKALGVN